LFVMTIPRSRRSTLWYNLALGLFGRECAVAEQLQARRFWISGSVQGVGYRFFAVRAAQRLGLAGFVRNLGDGRVEIYAIGDARQLEELRQELERGPRAAQVTGVSDEETELLPRYADGFSIELE
jgi:acylphosphatase